MNRTEMKYSRRSARLPRTRTKPYSKGRTASRMGLHLKSCNISIIGRNAFSKQVISRCPFEIQNEARRDGERKANARYKITTTQPKYSTLETAFWNVAIFKPSTRCSMYSCTTNPCSTGFKFSGYTCIHKHAWECERKKSNMKSYEKDKILRRTVVT